MCSWGCYKAAPWLSLTDISLFIHNFSSKIFLFFFRSLTYSFFFFDALLVAWSTQIFVIKFWFITEQSQYFTIFMRYEKMNWFQFKSRKREFLNMFHADDFFMFYPVCLESQISGNTIMLLCCVLTFSVLIFSISLLLLLLLLYLCIYVFVQCLPWKIITDILTTEFNLKDIKKDWGRYIGIHVILICPFKRMNIWMITA